MFNLQSADKPHPTPPLEGEGLTPWLANDSALTNPTTAVPIRASASVNPVGVSTGAAARVISRAMDRRFLITLALACIVVAAAPSLAQAHDIALALLR